jgi:hypothetical protein
MSDLVQLPAEAAHAVGSAGYHIDLPTKMADPVAPKCAFVADSSLCNPANPSYWRLFLPESRGCEFLSCKASTVAAAATHTAALRDPALYRVFSLNEI